MYPNQGYQNQGYPNQGYPQNPYGSAATSVSFPDVFRRVYLWLAIGLAVGFGVAYFVGQVTFAQIAAGQYPIIANPIVYFGSLIVYLALGFFFRPIVYRVSPAIGGLLFVLFAAVFGFMVSSIFIVYTTQSIAYAFVVSATMFAIMSIIGYTTRLDLSKFGAILFMGLIGIIVASIVNVFLQNSMLVFIISIIGVVLFCALTAYDTQWIKRNAIALSGQYRIAQQEMVGRVALIGAFRLFLDLINLFMFLLSLGGRRR